MLLLSGVLGRRIKEEEVMEKVGEKRKDTNNKRDVQTNAGGNYGNRKAGQRDRDEEGLLC